MEQAFYEEDLYEDFTIKLLCVMFEMLPVFLKSGRLRAFLGNLFENRLLLLLSVHTYTVGNNKKRSMSEKSVLIKQRKKSTWMTYYLW